MAITTQIGALDSLKLTDGDTFFQSMNARLRPDQLQPGQVAYSQNGRMGVDGAWQVRKGHCFIGGGIGSDSESITLPFTITNIGTMYINAALRTGSLVHIWVTGHGLSVGDQINVSGLGWETANPNGNRTVSEVTDANEIHVILPQTLTDGENYTGLPGATIQDAVLFEQAAFGSCLFSDPAANNSAYIILALPSYALAVSVSTGAQTIIQYPNAALSSSVSMLQAFNKVFIFRDGATAWQWNGSFSGTPAFTKVANGTYAANAYYDSSNNTTIADGVVTVSETGHGLSVGTTIFVVDSGSTSLVEGGSGYVVATVPSANSFTFYADVSDSSASTVVYSKRVSEGLGFTHMPAPPWGVYHQRRLIVPFFYTTTGTSGSEVVASRNVRDEILISDVFDSDTYDQVFAQLKVTAGIADYLQYVHPFTEDNAVVFNRNSIHLLSGLSGDIGDMSLKEITREAGLVAQRSVVTVGNRIFFLSDNGVYATEFGDLYNLRGAGLPLSDPIDPIIRRINPQYAANAVACFHNNRYYIAVPLDESRVNNYLLVYNMLSGGWESVDYVPQAGWDISNLISAGSGTVKELYGVNKFGGIHRLECREDGMDLLVVAAGGNSASYPIESSVTTRQYTHGTSGKKKFVRFEAQVESNTANASDAQIGVATENMDEDATLGTIGSYLGSTLSPEEDAVIAGRIGNYRGYGIQFVLSPSQGRPKLRMVTIDAVSAARSTTSVS